MRQNAKKLALCLAILASALLFMGSTPKPTAPPPSRVLWSQDGEHVVFSIPFQGIYVVDTAGTSLWTTPERTLVGDQFEPGNYAPDLSPDGSRVVYVTYDKYELLSLLSLDVASDNSLDTTLHTIQEFFSLETPEIDSGYSRLDFLAMKATSPVAYSLYGSPIFRAAIETSSIDGTDVRRLTVYKDLNGDGEIDRHTEVDPVWSPDGKRIAFKSNQSVYTFTGDAAEPGLRLSIMDADGSNVRMLAPAVRLMASERAAYHSGSRPPVWSPDGKWIAFVGWEKSEEGGQTQTQRHILYTVQPNGSGLTKIAETHKYGLLAWSPDSSLLAFVSPELGDEGQSLDVLFTVRPDRSDLTRISEVSPSDNEYDNHGISLSAIDTQRVWSPDSAWLAFARADEEGPGVYVVRPDGTDERLLARGYGGPVSWSSDGTKLYIAGIEYAVQPDGSDLRPFLADKEYDAGQWTLTAWLPDGSRLAVLGWPDEQAGLTLFTVAGDGTDKRVLARQMGRRLVAEHTDWLESPRSAAACTEGFIVPDPETNHGLVNDCMTLLGIRDILSGDAYVNWSIDEPIKMWGGVEIGCPLPLEITNVIAWQGIEIGCPSPYRVIGLRLSGMFGEIPPGIAELSSLKALELQDGQLVGGIPPQLGNLSKLEELRLDRTLLYAEIPPELGRLSNLRVLSLSLNGLTGSIPPDLGNLAKLEELSLDVNELSGKIPPELARLSNLKVLSLNASFYLSGGIPPDLGKLTRLEELSISFSQLGGYVPSELGDLANLRVLQLELNGLSGRIPPELGNLSELKVLSLAGNGLSGNIPPELVNLSRLRVLSLHGNKLMGTIPPWLGRLGALEELYLAHNSFASSIPRELGELARLQTLSVKHNKLTGPIPPELGRLTNLWGLHISYNSLSGCIPATLSNQVRELRARELEFCTE